MGQYGIGRTGGWSCTGGVKYNIVAKGRMQKGIQFSSWANIVNFKNACFQYLYVINLGH